MGWSLLKCVETNANCTREHQQVEADPDVAGIGVVTGFLSTTCISFLIAFTVIFLDRYEEIVNCYQCLVKVKKPIYEQDTEGPYWRSTGFWSRVLSKNLLAFSDTQLVTGLAIQFTALVKHCDISIYHFVIVTDLAMLTTVTHLLTVVALRNYFVKNKWINLPRIFFMLANLGLLGYTSFVAHSYELVPSPETKSPLEPSMPLACFYQSRRPRFRIAFGGQWAVTLIGAIGSHATIILAMYWLDNDIQNSKTQQQVQTDTLTSRYRRYSRRAIWYKYGAAFRTWVFAPAYAMYGISMAGRGLRKTQALGKTNVELNGSERDWSFGQFLPVLLLALPVFAGWESFWEEKDEDRENWFGTGKRKEGEVSYGVMVGGVGLGDKVERERESDLELEERVVESAAASPVGTPRSRSASGTSISLQSDGLLMMPVPATSPRQGIDLNEGRLSRSPSK